MHPFEDLVLHFDKSFELVLEILRLLVSIFIFFLGGGVNSCIPLPVKLIITEIYKSLI